MITDRDYARQLAKIMGLRGLGILGSEGRVQSLESGTWSAWGLEKAYASFICGGLFGISAVDPVEVGPYKCGLVSNCEGFNVSGALEPPNEGNNF